METDPNPCGLLLRQVAGCLPATELKWGAAGEIAEQIELASAWTIEVGRATVRQARFDRTETGRNSTWI